MAQFPDLDRYPYIGYDTETTGLNHKTDQAFGFSVATPDGFSEYWDIRSQPESAEWFSRAIAGYKGIIVCHNASFDYKMSHAARIPVPLAQLDDTAIRACLLDDTLKSYSLDDLSKRYIGASKENDIYEELAGYFGGRATRKVQMPNIANAPAEMVRTYAAKDALLTMRLWEEQNDIAERQDNYDLACPSLTNILEFERSLMVPIIEMECHGIAVDVDQARYAAEQLTVLIHSKEKELTALVGRPVNVNSSPQIREIFKPEKDDQGFWAVNDVILESTKAGAPSLGADSLRSIPDPRAKLILEIRSLLKTRDTFLMGHVVNKAYDGRVYPTIWQTRGEYGGTYTGRLSYQNPAMQQIPSRNKSVASIVKPVFLPDPGHQWLDVDMNSFEVRVFAHLVSMFDPRIKEQYEVNPDLDFHQYVADLTGLPRNASYSGEPNAKKLNLAMIFNSGNGSIADKMGKPWNWDEFETEDGELITYRKAGPEAMSIINAYHARLPGVKKLQQAAKEAAGRRGFVFTFKGRRLRFPDKRFLYKASGILIQATSAEVNKENIAIISDYLNQYGGKLLLNVHDSYSMSIPEGSYDDIWPGLRTLLEEPGRLNVPLKVDVSGIGESWWGALNNQGRATK